MRNAVAGRASFERCSEKATGELIDTETVTISSEEGRWKRAERYLAGGLPYRDSNVEDCSRRRAVPEMPLVGHTPRAALIHRQESNTAQEVREARVRQDKRDHMNRQGILSVSCCRT